MAAYQMSLSFESGILLSACFLGGLASTMVGTSGGFTFAAMASVLPVSVVVPVHATVEAAASIVRCAILRRYVQWRFFFVFVMFVNFVIIIELERRVLWKKHRMHKSKMEVTDSVLFRNG